MSVSFKANFDLKASAREIRQRVAEELLKAAIDATAEIKQRTAGGTDVDGEAFGPYTPEYAAYKYKQKKRGGFGFKSKKAAFEAGAVQSKKYSNFGRVNLLLTGRMLEGMRATVKREAGGLLARIYFNSAKNAAKARGHMEGYRNHNPDKIRNFFALSGTQMAEIVERIKRVINGR